MRLLHTSDWHLGRTFHGRSLLGDQEVVLTALAAQVREKAVDAVLMAGDLYDRAVPSVDAINLATRIFEQIRLAGAQIVLSTGNHDSAPRLGAFADFLAAGGLHIRSNVDQIDRPVMLSDAHGEVAVYGIPYLEPDVSRAAMGVPEVRGHAGVLGEAMRRVRADLAGRPVGTRSVVLSHAFVIGGAATDSERTLEHPSDQAPAGLFDFKRGTVGSVPAAVYHGVDYVALGHLHRRQQIAPNLRFCGSPLPYSFSEAGQRKGGWVVDLDADGVSAVEPFELPVVRELDTVRGRLEDVLRGHEHLRDHYLAFQLTDEVRPVEAMRRLVERFPFATTVEWDPPSVDRAPRVVPTAERPVGVMVESFVLDCRGTAMSETERGWVAEALTAVRVAEAAA